MEKNAVEIPELNKETIKNLVYEIRGQKVMLDFELAEIYGYETKKFNQQVKNNKNKFPDDFMFKLTQQEQSLVLRSKKLTAKSLSSKRRYLPYVFTEQGIYMLMTVLKGEVATKQSIALVRAFKEMKDYIIENGHLLMNTNNYIESKFSSYDSRFEIIESKLEIVMDNFADSSKYKHFLILNGEKIEADVAYQTIYHLATQSIIIVDNYIDVKTLQLLKSCERGVEIIIVTDNKAKNGLSKEYIDDFKSDTDINIKIKRGKNRFHDRYIIIDYRTNNEIIYHCGASSKDSGNRITTINRLDIYEPYDSLIEEILNNEDLIFE